jgi:hypothetical protein
VRGGLGSDVESDAVGAERAALDRVGGDDHVLGVCAELRGDHDIRRDDEVDAPFLGLGHVPRDRVELFGVEQALADLVALRGEEGEQHPSPDEQSIDLGQQGVDHAELVADLGAAEHDRVRLGGIARQLREHAQFGFDQASGSGGQRLRQLVHTGLLAMHDAESVGDEGVAELGKRRRERRALARILRRLLRVEAEVLEQDDVAILQRLDGRVSLEAHRVAGEGDGRAEQLAQPHRDRRQAVAGIGCAVGTAEVRDGDDSRTGSGQLLNGAERRADATVVGDAAVIEGDVQVAADDDPLALKVSQRFDRAKRHGRGYRRSATYSVMSTRRLE